MNINIIAPWVVVVLVIWFYVQHSQQSQAEKGLNDMLKELASIKNELKQNIQHQQGDDPLSKQTESTSIILPSLDVPSNDVLSFGLQLQKEGKHNGYFVGNQISSDVDTLLTKWTMYQKLWFSQSSCSGKVCDLKAKDSEHVFELATDPSQVPTESIDFLYFQMDDPKTTSNALGSLRNIIPKCRVGSLIMLVAPSKDTGYERIVRQLVREVCNYY